MHVADHSLVPSTTLLPPPSNWGGLIPEQRVHNSLLAQLIVAKFIPNKFMSAIYYVQNIVRSTKEWQ